VVKALYPLPVLSNGNVRCPQDIIENLAATGAAGIMVGEYLLKDPAVFGRACGLHRGNVEEATICAMVPTLKDLAVEYLELLKVLDEWSSEVLDGDYKLKAEDDSVAGANIHLHINSCL
jgi:tRNA-dihydrouridine synthase